MKGSFALSCVSQTALWLLSGLFTGKEDEGTHLAILNDYDNRWSEGLGEVNHKAENTTNVKKSTNIFR